MRNEARTGLIMAMIGMLRRLLDERTGLDLALAQPRFEQRRRQIVLAGLHLADVGELAPAALPHTQQQADEVAAPLRPAADEGMLRSFRTTRAR